MFLGKTEVKNLRGGIGSVFIERFSILPVNCKMYAKITIPQGSSIGVHTHIDDEEIVYVLEGEGKVKIDDCFYSLKKGDVNITKKGNNHSIINEENEPLIILAIINE